MVGIVGYGAWIPYMRINVDEIHRVWRNLDLQRVKVGLKLDQRAVLQPNEDTITLAVGAAERALAHATIAPSKIGAFFFGTCTNPYDSRPSVTTAAEALGLGNGIFSCDVQFAGKSGTTATQIGLSMIQSGMVSHALCIGSDTINRHTSPGRVAEYAASAAAVALVLGEGDVIAEITGTASHASELSDSFRVEGERYIQDIGTGEIPGPCTAFEIGILEHSAAACKALLEPTGQKPSDFDYVIFQQPNGITPYALGERLGFTEQQIQPGNLATQIGDCGSASALLGLGLAIAGRQAALLGAELQVCNAADGGAVARLCLAAALAPMPSASKPHH